MDAGDCEEGRPENGLFLNSFSTTLQEKSGKEIAFSH